MSISDRPSGSQYTTTNFQSNGSFKFFDTLGKSYTGIVILSVYDSARLVWIEVKTMLQL